MVYDILFACLAGFLLDFILGDPYWLYHPVRLIGKLIQITEKILRKLLPATSKGELIGGFILVLVVLIFSGGIPFLIIQLAYQFNRWLGFSIMTVMCYQTLAARCLKKESMKVYRSLNKKDIEEARYNVSMIVGRDTRELTEEGIIKAAVETVAENTSDGVIAPLCYLLLGGPVLGFLYKAVNTMDSMVGYKNSKYLYFGRCAARLDDILNYIPSRIAAYLFIVSCPLTGLRLKEAFRIYRRDNRNHSSPNSAQTESACAGALGVQLGGDASYFGVIHHKKTIGDNTRPVVREDIKRANRLMYVSSLLALLLFGGCRAVIMMYL
ncbi:MAG: adenosylcobinamide-phosphate synthase [Anaerocolumna sp.]|jgi:adenosylcobinamide-phosphate synthase|nr:adenosylcobinamide-phosphate synthase [Anaerocolumna sp.]